ncbi:PAS domain-containing sensor histidine kinase [Enterovirga aerilata]|uniref:PAS domain-containing sensor histidine kinase n=1 Tax=Enterovirga aerilata TaxID=2730920 RepID=UPI001AEDB600|nr:ATP-binding protein [Enterovirga sp. DB1703]
MHEIASRSGLAIAPLLRRIAPSTLKLEYVTPALVAGILLALVPAALSALRADRDAAIEDGLVQSELTLALLAQEIARAAGSGPAETAHFQAAARRLPAGALSAGRLFLTDDAGRVVAAVPSGAAMPAHIGDLLDEEQPLAILADQAGAMRIRLQDGTDALAALRNVRGGQVAIVKPVAELAAAREPGLPPSAAAAAFILAFAALGGACLAHARGARVARAACSRMQRRVDTSLARGRCGLWDWDISRGRIYWSSSLYGLLGYQRRDEYLSFGEVNGMIHPDDGNLFELAKRIASAGVRHLDHDFRMRTAEGGWLWLRARAEVVTDPEDGGRHLVGIAVDISDERGFVERSAKADMRLRDAIEAISEAFVLWDSENRLVLCNSKFRKFHDLSPEAVVPGATYAEIIAAGRPPRITSHVTHECTDGAGARTLEVQLSDGRWLQINERRTKDGGYVSVGTDITALKRHEEKLRESERRLLGTVSDLKRSRETLQLQAQQLADLAERYHEQKAQAETANRAKTDFLAKVSHELRTPLNAVIGFAEVMQREMFGPLGDERYRDYAGHIRGSGLDLLAVINDILHISRIEAGHVTLATGPLDVGEAVRDAIAAVEEPARQKGVTIDCAVRGQGFVQADERALHDVLTQILQNSVKFAPEGAGTIRVRVARAGRVMNFFIEDDGPGIPREFMPRLGRPFEQVEPEFNRAQRGTGLGLAIAKALTRMHRGGLRIRSQVGVGTIVLVSIPLSEAEAADRPFRPAALPFLQAAE